MQELMKSLKESRDSSFKKKKLVISLDEIRYKEFITGIILTNNGEEDLSKTYQDIINKVIDSYLDSVDFYDLTEEDMDSMVDIFEEIM